MSLGEGVNGGALNRNREVRREADWGWVEEGASEHGELEVLSGDSDGAVQREGRN